jgi:polyisoprenoid-binding protein YceI
MSDTATLVPTGTWNVDPTHSQVGFAVKHLGIATVRGVFKQFEGSLEIGEDLASTRARGTVQTASIDTNDGSRDEHLRGSDFFDVESYPEITFESTSIEAAGEDEWKVLGNLTIHGVTNEIELNVEIGGTENDPYGNERVGLEANGQISRSDYGMKFNIALGSGNAAVGDKVKISLDISAVKRA